MCVQKINFALKKIVSKIDISKILRMICVELFYVCISSLFKDKIIILFRLYKYYLVSPLFLLNSYSAF